MKNKKNIPETARIIVNLKEGFVKYKRDDLPKPYEIYILSGETVCQKEQSFWIDVFPEISGKYPKGIRTIEAWEEDWVLAIRNKEGGKTQDYYLIYFIFDDQSIGRSLIKAGQEYYKGLVLSRRLLMCSNKNKILLIDKDTGDDIRWASINIDTKRIWLSQPYFLVNISFMSPAGSSSVLADEHYGLSIENRPAIINLLKYYKNIRYLKKDDVLKIVSASLKWCRSLKKLKPVNKTFLNSLEEFTNNLPEEDRVLVELSTL